MKYLKIFIIVSLLSFGLFQIFAWADDPKGNLVICAGESWTSHIPGNYTGGWRVGYKDNLADRSGWYDNPATMIFYQTRFRTGYYWGTPPWSWPFGIYAVDFSNAMGAIEYNPTDEFAALNTPVSGADNANYAMLMYNTKIPGAGDPKRDYHIPPEGGSVLSADRTFAYAESGWPTQLGVDVKLRLYSWTLPYGHMDDFILYEIEFYNTGLADINGDGTVDLGGPADPVTGLGTNKIHALCLQYGATVFGFRIYDNGGRGYWQPNSRFRGMGQDLTPDENGYPWDIGFQAYGSDPGYESFPGMGGGCAQTKGLYYDQYNGYTYLGAKKYDPDTGTWGEKKLCFKDANGNEVIPAVGEGPQRGWFDVWQPGYNSVNDGTPKGAHISAMGCFYKDGGKSNSKMDFDLSPNPALFSSGTAGDPTSFVVKDPSEWSYPDGAYEKTAATMATDPETGQQLGLSPMDALRGRPLEPGIITEGLITEYRFDGDPVVGFGPFSLEPGERIRVYFVRGSGFRILGLRKTIKAARKVFASFKPNAPLELSKENPVGNETFDVPLSPPVPDIKVTVSSNIRPLVKWQDPSSLGDFDGIKIYKARAWPRYNSLVKGWPTHDVWWKTMDPTVVPDPVPYNPVFTAFDRLSDQQAGPWGPYDLVKVIPKGEFGNYANPDASDKKTYPYAWEDNLPGTLPGFSFWYYVATYNEGAALPANYVGLEPSNIDWLESGKVNVNGRSGKWEGTWPWSESDAYFPGPTETQKRKDVGARFVLVSPPTSVTDLEMGRLKIGVRPNPYKRAAFHDVLPAHNLLFYNLPPECNISIFDVSGMLVDKIHFIAEDPTNGTVFWDMYSKNGNEIASGLYIWVAEYKGGKQTGYFSIIR